MINLLTKEEKNRLKKEKRRRQVIVLLLIISVWLFVSLILNAVWWYNLTVSQKIMFEHAPTAEELFSRLKKPSLSKEFLTEANALLTWWPSFYWFQTIAELDKNRTTQINLSQIAGTYDEKTNQQKLLLRGEAIERQVLVDFAESLKKVKFYEVVDLPIDSLLLGEGGYFILNLTISK